MILRVAARSLARVRPSHIASHSPIRPRSRYLSVAVLPRAPKRSSPSTPSQARRYTSISEADEKIEEIQDLYATARDEFEIAAEETDKKTVYAADDRAAAQEELKKLKDFYNQVLEESTPEVSNEIKSRVGQRIRELDHAVQGMEEAAKEE